MNYRNIRSFAIIAVIAVALAALAFGYLKISSRTGVLLQADRGDLTDHETGSTDGFVSDSPPLEFTDVREVVLSDSVLYIPTVYLRFDHTTVSLKSAKLQTYYPGDAPVLEDPDDLWKRGEWYKNVSIIISRPPKPNIRAVLDSSKKLFRATFRSGTQYGLEHWTHEVDDENDWDEVWVNTTEERPVSFISCDPIRQGNAFPQCKHHIVVDKLQIKASYDRRLLPEWSAIETNIRSMVESFKSEAESRARVKEIFENNEK